MKNSKGPEIAAGWHGIPAVPASDRLPSLDAFRGFVIMAMIFVNHLGENAPAWMHHAKPNTDSFTATDLIFPGFLFMVGFAMPLSFLSKMEQGVTFLKLLWRVAARAAVLLFLGAVMVSLEENGDLGLNEQLTGMSRALWASFFYLSMIFLCLTLPKDAGALRAKVQKWLKVGAGILLVFLLYVYKANDTEGHVIWLQTYWWGILGRIGWAYLGAGILYLVFRGRSTALMGFLAFIIVLDIGDRHELLNGLGPLTDLKEAFGSRTATVIAGMLLGNLFVGKEKRTVLDRVTFMVFLGLGLYAAGMLLRPLYGIDKNSATVSYVLVSSGISCWVYLFFYWVIEIMKARKWAEWSLVPIGQNALLAYLFSEGFYYYVKVIFRIPMPDVGDVMDGVVVVLIVSFITWVCTKNKVFLRL
jgi:predicted acyltransferase